ncbi:adenylate/guanylate cyclase domain-containing protein [Pseudobdellovibrio exovorus]|uniref:Guanylate cyclase domain-containing protein n=1 Tax=Pseudobdellovibrio exovorus JSS TaxID=1184267 RepID=M4V6W3_9BACT|nr:adenylate/guanylate cyclase domain-containing protein [Pseudobdellovibrio exovorus]AGH95112.1 hypothetical protein A11Q_896 [Pseudobdellovibrio exovorus JSS]
MKSKNSSEFKASLVTPLIDVKSHRRVECLWFFDLPVSPSEIWPFMADTSRMNRDLGLPAWNESTVNGEMHVESVSLGRLQKWIEKPWIWLEPTEIQNHRVFSQGWMTEQRGVFKIYPTSSGCRVAVYFQWGFKSVFSQALFQLASNVLKNKFSVFFDHTVQKIKLISHSKKQSSLETVQNSSDASVQTPSRVDQISQEFIVEKKWNDSKRKMFTYFLSEDELSLDRVHPKQVASKMNLSVSQFLFEARDLLNKGFLYLTWDVICPHCRGAVASEKYLSAISNQNKCEACEIEFALDQEESVEVVFKLTDKLRAIQLQQYCAAEPAKKRHIKLCQIVSAAQTRSFSLHLPEGRYRLRGAGFSDMLFTVDKASDVIELVWDSASEIEKIQNINSDFLLTIHNNSNVESEIILEETWWLKDKLLPGEILSMPQFRDLFSTDYLGSGVKLYLGQQVLLFTDIVGSTPLYKDLGDAKAFEAVRRHYEKIERLVLEDKGVLVKFIGDAVMAAYLDLADAVRSSVRIQKEFSDSDEPIKIRVSLNHGPVLCANLNVGLDYFGATVNTAAKIQKWGGAHQIVMTQEIWEQTKSAIEDEILKVETHYDEKLDLNLVVLSV